MKENSLKNENSVINFHKILRKFYKNEPQLEILEKNIKSTSKNITEITKLEKMYKDLSEQLLKTKRKFEVTIFIYFSQIIMKIIRMRLMLIL